jgi:fluoride exporter
VTGGAWLAFAVAAAIGAPARYVVDGLVQDRTDSRFPWGTFVVNMTGLGAYTTFSTLTFETVRLAEEGSTGDAVRNAAGSFIVGLAAAAAGLALAAIV